MLRQLLPIAARSSRLAAPSTSALRFVRPSPISISKIASIRGYAAAAGLSRDEIQSRVMDVLKTFEKVDGGKLSSTASFTSDLGLDSLDAVEVVMAIEEEFAIEIPDAEADEITTVAQAIDYIAKVSDPRILREDKLTTFFRSNRHQKHIKVSPLMISHALHFRTLAKPSHGQPFHHLGTDAPHVASTEIYERSCPTIDAETLLTSLLDCQARESDI